MAELEEEEERRRVGARHLDEEFWIRKTLLQQQMYDEAGKKATLWKSIVEKLMSTEPPFVGVMLVMIWLVPQKDEIAEAMMDRRKVGENSKAM